MLYLAVTGEMLVSVLECHMAMVHNNNPVAAEDAERSCVFRIL